MIFTSHRYHFVILAFLVLISTFLFFQRNENVFPVSLSRTSHSSSSPDLSDTFANLFRPIKLSPTHPGYRDAHGRYIAGAPADEVVWNRPLGKKLLIVDIDTRRPTGENQIFNTERKIDWETLQYDGTGLVTGGISSHYLYAMIHGYDYMHYQALEMEDIHQTWIKPHIFKELLPDYQFVVFFDADAVVSHLEIPLEWMFNRWGITENTMIAMPHDTEEFRDGKPVSEDSSGLPVLNSGFVVLQNQSLTFDMLSAWAACTTEERYEGCAVWKHIWSHEQRAFSEYIRHDPEFNVSSDSIIGIPCDDAMGWPGFKEQMEARGNKGISDCSGHLVRHYTLGKEALKLEGANIIMQSLMEIVQKNIIKHQAATYKKEHDPTVVLDNGKNNYDEIEKLNAAKVPDKSSDKKETSGKPHGENKSKDRPETTQDDEIDGGDEEDEEDDEEEVEVDTTGVANFRENEEENTKEKEAKKKAAELEKQEEEFKKKEEEFKKMEEEFKKKEDEFRKIEEEAKKKEGEAEAKKEAEEEEAKKKVEEEEAKTKEEDAKKKEVEPKKEEDTKDKETEKKGSEKEEVKKAETRGLLERVPIPRMLQAFSTRLTRKQ